MMTKIYKYRLKRKNEEGQSILEFVLVLPIFALVLFLIIDYGWLFINYIESENASRNAARIACVEYKTVNLENGAVVSPKLYTLDDLDDDDINDETKDIIRQVKNSLPNKADKVKIKISYSNDIEAEVENRTVKNRSSGDVTIYVECRIPVFTPILGSGEDKMHYTLKSSSTFKVEKSDGV